MGRRECFDDVRRTPVAQIEVVIHPPLVVSVADHMHAQRGVMLQQTHNFTQCRLGVRSLRRRALAGRGLWYDVIRGASGQWGGGGARSSGREWVEVVVGCERAAGRCCRWRWRERVRGVLLRHGDGPGACMQFGVCFVVCQARIERVNDAFEEQGLHSILIFTSHGPLNILNFIRIKPLPLPPLP